MEIFLAILIGILFTIGTYLILSRGLFRIILGISILGQAINLLILNMGGLKGGAAPLLGLAETSYADPLPQALILTAIVINFATTALILVLAYRSYTAIGSDDVEDLRGYEDE